MVILRRTLCKHALIRLENQPADLLHAATQCHKAGGCMDGKSSALIFNQRSKYFTRQRLGGLLHTTLINKCRP
eukprot:scaffold50691_cov19-Tisochrysis_lutea.AAC.2